MTPCDRFNDQLWDDLYGLLDEAEAQPLRAHVAACPRCQEELRIAQAQQKLLARAAQAIRAVPPFSLPGEELTAAPVVAPVETPPVLPFPAAAPVRRRRRWPGWAAAAAVLLAALTGNHVYQEGLGQRQTAVAAAKRNVDDVNVQFAALQANLQVDLDRQAALVKKSAVHLTVAGPSQAHPDVGNKYRVAARDLDGKAQTAQVEAQVIDDVSKKVLRETKLTCVGEADLNLPALDVPAKTTLLVTCKTQAGNAQIAQDLTRASRDYVSHIALNKAIYQVHELAFFRTLTLDRFSHKPPAEPLALRFSLITDQGKVVKERVGQTGPGGICGGDFALTSDLPPGVYTLQVTGLDPAKTSIEPQTRRLEIIRETGPTVEVNLDRANALRAGQKASVPIRVLRPDGQPAANEAVIANLNTDPQAPAAVSQSPGGKGGAKDKAQYQQLRLDNDGQALLQFQMPEKLTVNNCVLEVELFEGKGNRRALQTIPAVPSQLEIDAFPEGGDLIAGVPNQVYFRVRTGQGGPVSPEGRVLFLSNKTVLFDGEPGEGVGAFTFVPDPRETYTARITGPEGTAEIANPFQQLGIKTSGVALHAAQAVTRDDEPCQLALHNAGEPRTLLVLAVCRGQLVGHQTVAVKDRQTVSLPMAQAANGLVRLTIYEIAGGKLNPVAERLIFRLPTARLNVAVTQLNGGAAVDPGQHVQLGLKMHDEKGQAQSVWCLAAVADDRFQGERRERGLGAHFHLASELKVPEDLDQANVALVDTPANRQALGLFLGTQGWRRFVGPPVPAQTKAQVASAPLFFQRENNTLANLRANAETKYQLVAADLRDQANVRQRTLQEEKDSHLRTWENAGADVLAFQALPGEWLRLVLGGIALLLVLAGCLFLLWSLVKVSRRAGSPTLALAGAFASLALCLILYLAARQLLPEQEDQRAATGPRDRRWLDAASQPLAWASPSRDHAPMGQFAAVERAPLGHNRDHADVAKGKTAEGAGMNREQTTKAGEGLPWAQYNFSAPVFAAGDSSKHLNSELGNRFELAEEAQKKTASANYGDGKTKTPPLNPVDPTAAAKELPNWAVLNRARAYVHTRQFRAKDYQDTVLWHPALFSADGNAQVAFDLSSSFANYRVLIFANSPDGRLGFYEGRLEVREAGKK